MDGKYKVLFFSTLKLMWEWHVYAADNDQEMEFVEKLGISVFMQIEWDHPFCSPRMELVKEFVHAANIDDSPDRPSLW